VAWLGAAATRTVAPPVQPGLLIDDVGARLIVSGLEALSRATGVLPRRAVGEPLCTLAGTLWYLGAPAARAAVRDNLQHITGRTPSNRLVRAVFVHGALNYWDTLAITQVSREQLLSIVDMHGREHIDSALAAGRGVILAGAHLGSVSLVGQIVPALGYPMTALVEQIRPQRLYDFFAGQRQRFGLTVLPAGGAAVRALLTALHRNEVLGLVTDRDVTGTGPMVRFFDATTQFADGPAVLALRTGAPILPAVVVRKARARFDAIIEPPVEFIASDDNKRNVMELTQSMAKRLQYHVGTHPEQWTVFQNRWPTATPGSE
jgi:lauroyl/myristoyl acyltransferase